MLKESMPRSIREGTRDSEGTSIPGVHPSMLLSKRGLEYSACRRQIEGASDSIFGGILPPFDTYGGLCLILPFPLGTSLVVVRGCR